jgi:deoxyribodipyrimidine photo-lyase
VRTADRVVPAFVLDDAILASQFNRPNRTRFLLQSLHDLDLSLRERGAGLVVRRGGWAEEVGRLARQYDAHAVHVTDDVSGYAQRRTAELDKLSWSQSIAITTGLTSAVTVVPAGEVRPSGSDAYRVFTPYYQRWLDVPWRDVVAAPEHVPAPPLGPARVPALDEIAAGAPSPDVVPGGEREGRRRMHAWLRHRLDGYEGHADDLAANATSRMSPYLHFGCVSPLELTTVARGRSGGDPFVRQLCWRDFFHQLLAARPGASWSDLRPARDAWREDPDALAAWRAGHTGYPIVDAAMRQLAAEGWMPNRARMIVASFLTKDLRVDWRAGAQHFLDFLVDGDVANNNLNWQWVAGTGNDTNPHRVFNPIRQARRFDPDGAYVRRWIPELAGLAADVVHEPWRLGPLERQALDYPEPIVDHAEAIRELRAERSRR